MSRRTCTDGTHCHSDMRELWTIDWCVSLLAFIEYNLHAICDSLIISCIETSYYYCYIHLMAFFQDNLGKPAPER